MKTVIASLKTTDQAGFDNIASIIRKIDPYMTGMVAMPGPGCTNFGFCFNPDTPPEHVEEAMSALTMALMPARWAYVSDNDLMVESGAWEYKL